MNLTGTIESAERQFKQILEDFFMSVYNEKVLSSHGIDHHRRVWYYSRELLNFPDLFNFIPTRRDPGELPSKLIIACYLHDIGMSIEPGIKHGKHSRDLCVRFLNNNGLPESEYHDVLDAIENHDNKDYESNTGKNDILTILTISDDLDAFGFIGISRYSEIYLIRGINTAILGTLIRENAAKRFANFVKTIPAKELTEKHRIRYDSLDHFFIKYNEQLSSNQSGKSDCSGYCGVIEMISLIIERKTDLKELINISGNQNDPILKWYFAELKKELEHNY